MPPRAVASIAALRCRRDHRPAAAHRGARRAHRPRAQPARDRHATDDIRLGSLEIDLAAYEVRLDGEPLELTRMEYRLLELLVTHPRRVYSRESLMSRMWGSTTRRQRARGRRARRAPAGEARPRARPADLHRAQRRLSLRAVAAGARLDVVARATVLSRRGAFAVHVEIWSDIACPWCYVGKRRFEAALAGFEHRDDVQVTWRSFELDPSAPRRPRRRRRPAPRRQVRHEPRRGARDAARMTDTAAAEGLEFRFDIARGGQHVRRPPRAAPRRRARPAGRDEGAHHARLPDRGRADLRPRGARAAGGRGRPAARARSATCWPATATPTRCARTSATAAQLGIHAVPFFVVDRALGASGAQPPAGAARAAAPGARAGGAGRGRRRGRELRARRLLTRLTRSRVALGSAP